MEIKESVGKRKPEIVEQTFNIRKNVFIDEYDDTALYFIIQHNHQVIGILRAIAISNQALKVGRVAVLKKNEIKALADY
ncbi:MAG TPA: hypothetical protein ACHBX0_12625 [Arsenophonus sp.]